MRKLLIGNVALVAAVIGVTACGGNDNARGKEPAAKSAAVPLQKTADVKPAGTSGLSAAAESQPVALETTPKPRFTLVLGEGKGGFKFRSAMLSDEAKAKITEMLTGEGAEPTLNDALIAARFEIEGYTDNLGSKQMNDQMGLARAKAVRQYLSEQFEIPMDRIGVTSYGMDKPVADNSTPEGRALNRRVVIKVVD